MKFMSKKKAKEILAYVQDHPGCIITSICNAVNAPKGAAGKVLSDFEMSHEVESVLTNGTRRYYIWGASPDHPIVEAKRDRRAGRSAQGADRATRIMDRVMGDRLHLLSEGPDIIRAADARAADILRENGIDVPHTPAGEACLSIIIDVVADRRADLPEKDIAEMTWAVRKACIKEFGALDPERENVMNVLFDYITDRDDLLHPNKKEAERLLKEKEKEQEQKKEQEKKEQKEKEKEKDRMKEQKKEQEKKEKEQTIDIKAKKVYVNDKRVTTKRGGARAKVTDEEYESRFSRVRAYLTEHPGSTYTEIAENYEADPKYGRMSSQVVYHTLSLMEARDGTDVSRVHGPKGRLVYYMGQPPSDLAEKVEKRERWIAENDVSTTPKAFGHREGHPHEVREKAGYDGPESVHVNADTVLLTEDAQLPGMEDARPEMPDKDGRVRYTFVVLNGEKNGTSIIMECTEREARMAAQIAKGLFGSDIGVAQIKYEVVYSTKKKEAGA